jgi:two-component system, NarL family, response regulator YdfI
VIRVLAIAASAITRAGLEALLRQDARFEVAGGRNNASAAMADVAVADLESRDRLAALIVSAAGIPTVLLADDLNRTDLRQALHNGVRAVLNRDAAREEIAAAIEAVAAGLAVLGREQMDALLPALPDGFGAGQSADEPLTARESEVLAMLAEGAGNKEIAARLKISEHTVKFHVSSILAKLGAASRTEAVSLGLREGLIII